MKVIIAVVLTVVGLSSFGQGYVVFQGIPAGGRGFYTVFDNEGGSSESGFLVEAGAYYYAPLPDWAGHSYEFQVLESEGGSAWGYVNLSGVGNHYLTEWLQPDAALAAALGPNWQPQQVPEPSGGALVLPFLAALRLVSRMVPAGRRA